MFKTLASLFLLGATALPAAAQISQPELYVVMFRADWCAPCKVVEPRLNGALRSLGDPSIEPVMFDISDPGLGEVAAHRAFDREIVPQYNRWLGLTGFAAIIDATSKQTLGCVNSKFSADEIAQEVRRHTLMAAGRAVKTDASTFQKTTECPPAHNK